jgi:ribosome recycling factor
VSEFADEIINDASERMSRAVEHAQSDFSSVRTGRATPALVEKLRVNYYGTEVPLQQLAGFSIPEARVLVVQPYDKTALAAVEKAIQMSDLGINPGNDGEKIRLVFPPLTTERRQELVKVVKQMAEDGKISIRNLRRSARHDLEAMQKDGDISEDDLDRYERSLDKLTSAKTDDIDRAFRAKETELLEV